MSPTAALESIISTAVIDVCERRDVAIFHIPGVYLHINMPEDKRVVMVLRGEFVDIMVKACPKYEKYVSVINGRKALYLRVLRAIYGCIQSALLWYELFSSKLQQMGFIIYPYDRCMANEMIQGKQCTIVWYVDDVKVSHVDPKVVTKIIEEIEESFGDVSAVRGDKHTFLGMNMTFTKDKKIHIKMKEHLQEAIDAFPEDINAEVTSPVGRYLMLVNEDAEKLDQHRADIFHSITAKLLYLDKRCRPDLEPTVAFLSTRVKEPDMDDWKKSKRALAYVKKTIDDVCVIGCENLNAVFTWVDAAYAVHPNIRSHTGGSMSMGWGVLHARSSKQKLNTKSLTEAELVGVSEYLLYNI